MAKANSMNGLEEAWLWAKKVRGSLRPRAEAGTVAVRSWNQCRPKAWREQSSSTEAGKAWMLADRPSLHLSYSFPSTWEGETEAWDEGQTLRKD